MGKKVMREASLKITHKHDKNKLNSLIKVLRPKVYITDSSSFKKLVQELTGNQTPVTPPSRPPPPPPPAVTLGSASEKFPVIEIDGGDGRETSACSSSEEAYNLLQPSFVEGARQVMDMTALDDFLMNQEADGLGFEEMGSWFLEMDPFSVSQNFEEAACIYDYDLTGLV